MQPGNGSEQLPEKDIATGRQAGKDYIMRNWKNWIKAAGIRALKTVAQTAVATIGTCAVLSEVNWITVGSAAVLAGILSLLTSLAGLPELEE